MNFLNKSVFRIEIHISIIELPVTIINYLGISILIHILVSRLYGFIVLTTDDAANTPVLTRIDIYGLVLVFFVHPMKCYFLRMCLKTDTTTIKGRHLVPYNLCCRQLTLFIIQTTVLVFQALVILHKEDAGFQIRSFSYRHKLVIQHDGTRCLLISCTFHTSLNGWALHTGICR